MGPSQIFHIQGMMSILISLILSFCCLSQPIVVVRGYVDACVHDGANTIHEQKHPNLPSVIGVPLRNSRYVERYPFPPKVIQAIYA